MAIKVRYNEDEKNYLTANWFAANYQELDKKKTSGTKSNQARIFIEIFVAFKSQS